MELRQYLTIIQRRKWIIIITTIVFTAIAAIVTFLATPQYVSRTTVRVATVTSFSYTQLLMNTYARIATGGTVKAELIEKLQLPGNPTISVELIPNTELMTITVEAPDPEQAQKIAETTAELLAAQSREIYSGSGQTTTDILAAQLAQADDELKEARAEYDHLLEDSPTDVAQIDAFNQSIALKERTYSTLLEQYEESRINEALLANSVSVVEPAYLPAVPAKPRVILNLVMGVISGLIVGVILAFVAENLDTRLYSVEQIESVTQAPTIGRIPAAKDDLQIARVNNGHYPQLEAFRRLRTNLLTPDDEDGSRIVMLTSAQRGEGKSTVAANLAVTVAHSGRKVLIVDCDMRLPTLHKKFELPNKRGLTSVLTQEVEVDEATLYTSFPRLHVLTSGPLPPNPTELLGSPRMVELVRQLTEEYDYVILDTPAMLSVADAAVLTPLADTVIWVVTESQTRRGDVETVRRQLNSMRAKSVEVVINRTSDTSDYAAYSPDGFALE